VIGMALLIAGASVDGWARPALWTTAAVIDLRGPICLGRGRFRRLQQVAVTHFAERYGDFVILGLGEWILSIVLHDPDDGLAIGDATTGIGR
jgi:low temperature requirement protein LtrA